MNPDAHDPEQRWARLVARARHDIPPRLDVHPLLARLQAERPPAAGGWLLELNSLLASKRWLATCTAGAVAMAAVAAWEIAAWREALVLMEWAYPGAGGGL